MVVVEMDQAVTDLRRVRMMDRAGTAATGTLLVGLAVGMARVVKDRMEGLGTMEDRKETTEDRKEVMGARTETLDQGTMEDPKTVLDQEATEARTATQAPTMGLANRTQAVSHKSTYTQRS
jgi:hypothetical protein